MNNWTNYVFLIGVLYSTLVAVSGLKCYVCDREWWNWGSCTQKFEQCATFQDACASYTAFQLPIKYEPRGERWHSISKGCDTLTGCERRQQALDGSTCSRTPYADWACVECCRGDLCNYYITLGASSVRLDVLLPTALMVIHVIRRLL